MNCGRVDHDFACQITGSQYLLDDCLKGVVITKLFTNLARDDTKSGMLSGILVALRYMIYIQTGKSRRFSKRGRRWSRIEWRPDLRVVVLAMPFC